MKDQINPTVDEVVEPTILEDEVVEPTPVAADEFTVPVSPVPLKAKKERKPREPREKKERKPREPREKKERKPPKSRIQIALEHLQSGCKLWKADHQASAFIYDCTDPQNPIQLIRVQNATYEALKPQLKEISKPEGGGGTWFSL